VLISTSIHANALVKGLRARWDIQRRILGEEVHWLERHLEDLARHDGEVFDPGNMVDTELDEKNDVIIDDILVPVRPRADTSAAAGLICVFATRV